MSEQDEKKAEEDPPLSCLKTFIYGLPGGALLPFTAMWALYGQSYYEEFGATPAFIAQFTAVARSFDLIIDPAMSYITDASGTGKLSCACFKRFGRRKPYMVFGAFCMGGSVWMLLNPPYTSSLVLGLWFGFFYVVYYIFETLTAIPYNAFGAELSNNSDERSGAFFMESFFEGLGTLFMVVAPVVFASIRVPMYSDRNDAVCLSGTSVERKEKRAMECLAGNSCGDFFGAGWKEAFTSNATLAAMMKGAELLTELGEGFDYSIMCSRWHTATQTNLVSDSSVINGNISQNTYFVECYERCDQACSVAQNRTAFMCVGYMFAMYIIPTVWLAAWVLKSVWDPAIKGRNPDSDDPDRSPPLVPSIMSTMRNPPFRILLPTWSCDGLVQAVVMALPYFYVQAVIAPAYMTMENHGIDCYESSPGYTSSECAYDGNEQGRCTGLASLPDSDFYDQRCNTLSVIAAAGGSFLFGAALACPFWMFLSYKFGKLRAWLWFSLAHAIAVLGFLFLGEGHVMFLWGLTFINGIPFGAKFLNDAVLADIVDYDEYLTGNRNEATYFMTKSFIPKIVQIPAQVLPIAFMPVAGYVKPIDGMVQRQPQSVIIYIKCVSFVGVIAAVAAYVLKFKYSLRDTKALELALVNIRQGKPGLDPITGRSWCPTSIDKRAMEEQDVFNDCAYFTHTTCRQILAGEKGIQNNVRLSAMVSIAIFVGLLTGVAATANLLLNDTLSFIPTLCTIGAGFMVAVNVFTVTRYFAAQRMLRKIADHHEPDSPGGVKRAKTTESIGKFVDYVKNREKVGNKAARDSFQGDQPAVDDCAGETTPKPAAADSKAADTAATPAADITDKDTDCEHYPEEGARGIKMMTTKPHATTFKS